MATVAMMASTTRSRQNDVCSNSPTAADVRLSLLDRNQPGCLGRRKRTERAQGGWRMCWKQMLTKPFQSNTRARVGSFRGKRNGKKRKSDAENDMKDSVESRMRMDELYRIWLCEVDELSADSSDDESWSNDRRHPYYSRVYDSNMSSTDSSDSEDEVRSSVSEYVRKGPSRMKMDIEAVCKGTKCGFDEQSDTSCQTSGSSDYSWDEESKGVNKNSKKNFLRNKFFRKKGFHNKRNSNKIPKKMTSDVFAKTHETREDEECIERLRGEGTTELAIICHGVVKTAQLKRITMRDNEIHANSSCVRKSISPQSDEESRFKINVACESDLNLPWGQIKHEFVSNASRIKDTQNFSSPNDKVMDKFNFVTILGGNGYHKLCDGESSDKIAEEEIFNYGKRNEVRDGSTLKQIAHSEDVADDRKNNLNLKDLEHKAPAHMERNLKASRDNNGSFVDNKRVFYQACQHVVPDYPSSHQNPKASKETYSIEQCEYQRFGCKFSGSKMIVEEHMKSCVLEHLKLVSEVAKEQKDRLKNQEDEQHRQSLLIQQLTDTINDLECLVKEHDEANQSRERTTRFMKNEIKEQRKQYQRFQKEIRNQIQTINKSEVSILPKRNCTAEYILPIRDVRNQLEKTKVGCMEDPIISEPFYTGMLGYKLSIWVYLNGRGKSYGNWISVYARVMSGDHDNILSWPIRPTYTFSLLDQSDNKKEHIVRKRTVNDIRRDGRKREGLARPELGERSVIVGFDDFIAHGQLEKGKYVVDDCLYIKLDASIAY